MDKIFFGLKRAYHGSLRVTRRALARLGLTAARFDLLYILDKVGAGGMAQREMQRALGVAAPTVSRMLRSLEELGLVEREAMIDDYRRNWLDLTEEGRRRVRRAARLIIHTGWVQLAVDSALCPSRWHSETACHLARVACDRTLGRFRHSYQDLATLHYPSVPDHVPRDLDRMWALYFAHSQPR